MGTPQFLKLNYILLAILLLFLFVVDSSNVNVEVEGKLNVKSPLIDSDNVTNNANELKGGANLKKEEQIEISEEVVRKDVVKRNVSKPFNSKENRNQEISGISSNLVLKDKDESGTDEGSSEGIDSKKGQSKERIQETSGSTMGVEKEKLRDEECDPAYMCFDEKKNLTACLRVPGNDSPDLSLLIQNKGKKPVIVTITAPDFVQLEETKVQLQEKEDKKVKVSIVAYKGIDSVILLTAKDSHCKLDLKELIRHDSRVEETRYAFNLRNLSNFTRSHLIIFLALTALLLLGCGWAYMGTHKKLLFGNGYKALNMELPVSASASVSETNDGWDKSWDDDWDDEEAPMTPTLPVTPNLSSRGLASRRLSKETWKD